MYVLGILRFIIRKMHGLHLRLENLREYPSVTGRFWPEPVRILTISQDDA